MTPRPVFSQVRAQQSPSHLQVQLLLQTQQMIVLMKKVYPEVATDDEGSDNEAGGSTTEELEGEEFNNPDVSVFDELPDNYPASIMGQHVYHCYDDGWYPGTVLRITTLSTVKSRNGKFAMKFEDSANEVFHTLKKDDYGRSSHWLLVKDES